MGKEAKATNVQRKARGDEHDEEKTRARRKRRDTVSDEESTETDRKSKVTKKRDNQDAARTESDDREILDSEQADLKEKRKRTESELIDDMIGIRRSSTARDDWRKINE